MATLTGRDGVVTIAGSNLTSTRNFSVDITADTIETSTMGVDVRTYIKGMSSWSGSADIYFNTSDVQANLLVAGSSATVGGAAVSVKFYIDSDVSNDVVLYGNGCITGYSVSSAMDGLVEATVSIQGSGPVVFSSSGNV
jgi:hypothetical protein